MTIPVNTYDSTRKRYLRGSKEQCPKCGSRKVGADMNLKKAGYGLGLATCTNCKVIWEPFEPSDVWDTSDPHCSFREPCNNCAFRPGSPEMADKEKWREMLQQLRACGSFFCHKGVPIEPGAEHGFAYPTKKVLVTFDGQQIGEKEILDISKLRLCRGYLRAMSKWSRREKTGTALDEMTEGERQMIEQANRQKDFVALDDAQQAQQDQK